MGRIALLDELRMSPYEETADIIITTLGMAENLSELFKFFSRR